MDKEVEAGEEADEPAKKKAAAAVKKAPVAEEVNEKPPEDRLELCWKERPLNAERR